MRKFHLEIDERRRSGDLKGSLDLARYAYAQLPNHQLIKRSYAWALYSYLKHKITSNLGELSSINWPIDVTRPQLLSDRPRRREINLLCREYRRHKLPTTDLCLSLLLRQLCRLKPAPLGLYGLLNWADTTGLRSEDHLIDPDHPHRPPLIFTLAIQLSSLVSHLDSERVLGLKPRVEPQRVAKLASRFYHCLVDSDDLSTDQQSYLLDSLWGTCWLNRRAGRFQAGLLSAQRLIHLDQSTPELWWEVAQIIAEESHIPLVLTHQGKVTSVTDPFKRPLKKKVIQQDPKDLTRHHTLKDAVSLALHSTHLARSQGVDEIYLSEVYARAGYWSGLIRNYPLAQALMWWSIELRRQLDIPSPYTWTDLLIQYGGTPSAPWSQLRQALNESLTHAQQWMKLHLPHNHPD